MSAIQLAQNIVDNNLEDFKKNLNSQSLTEVFNDPDTNKPTSLLNLVLSYADKDFFDLLLPYLNKNIIDQAVPESALFKGLKLLDYNNDYFLTQLMTFNPDLTVLDKKGNNLLTLLATLDNSSIEFAQQVLNAGVNPFLNREHSKENPYSSAAENKKSDLIKFYNSLPEANNSLTIEHLKSLIINGLGKEFEELSNTHSNVKDLMDADYLFNQACQAENVIALNTIIDKTMFIPGREQLSVLVKLMCQHYPTEEERSAALSLGQYLFAIKIPFDKFHDSDGNTAWSLAIRNNNNEIFNLLLDSPSTLNFIDYDNKTPLMYAVEEGNPEFVKKILAKKPYLISKDKNGNTALLKAVIYRHEEIVDLLAKQTNNGVNEPNLANQTPLNMAIHYKNIPMVNSLIWSGADISLHPYKTLNDNSVYGFDSSNNFDLLFESKDEKTIDNFNALIILGFNANQINKKGDTLLNHFIKQGHLSNFQSLVRTRIDVQIPDTDGNTPLFNAFEKNIDDYVVSLLTFHHHLDLEHKNANGETIYDIASYSNSARKVVSLVNSDPDLTKEKLSKILPILVMDANLFGLEKIYPHIDYSYIDDNGNDLLMLSVLHHNERNFEFLQTIGNMNLDLKQKNTSGKNIFSLIMELPEVKKADFINKLSSSNKTKYMNFEKKKFLTSNQMNP